MTKPYQNLNLTVTSGDVTVNGSNISTSNLSLELGDLYISDSQLQKTTMTLQTGDANLDNLNLTNSKITLATGDYYANDIKYLGGNTIVANSGDIDISLTSYNLTLVDKSDNEDNDITDQLQDSSDNSLTIQASVGYLSIQ